MHPSLNLAAVAWQSADVWIMVTAAVAAMSCTLPGVWLVLRQQSLMGDALSHTALPGLVIAFLLTNALRASGWISPETQKTVEPLILAGGAVAMGILTAVLTELVRKLGRVESSAALGVVFTSLFALGLFLLRLLADDVHIDTACVLFGQLELVVLESVNLGGMRVPVAVLSNGVLLLINGALLLLFFKELRLAAFDPEMATATGISAGVSHYLLMGVTAATVVLAFESVGSILVIALLIVPAACGVLLCDRLGWLIAVSLGVAAASAVLGHFLARTLPPLIFGPLGFPEVQDAGTPGMMAVACGLIFFGCLLFSPRTGLVSRWGQRRLLQFRMAADDVLATLFRFQEQPDSGAPTPEAVRSQTAWIGPLTRWLTMSRLRRSGLVTGEATLALTDAGRVRAGELVRSHRLWETYMHKHFDLPEDHLHRSAHVVEHYLDPQLQAELAEELDSPRTDPHGKEIPG